MAGVSWLDGLDGLAEPPWVYSGVTQGVPVDWKLVPALAASALMMLFGIAAALRPAALRPLLGVAAESPLGTSEIRAVFGGMFVALGLACIVLREPVVFAVVGTAWLADFTVRLASVFVDRVPARAALVVLGTALVMGGALLSGRWLA